MKAYTARLVEVQSEGDGARMAIALPIRTDETAAAPAVGSGLTIHFHGWRTLHFHSVALDEAEGELVRDFLCTMFPAGGDEGSHRKDRARLALASGARIRVGHGDAVLAITYDNLGEPYRVGMMFVLRVGIEEEGAFVEDAEIARTVLPAFMDGYPLRA